MQRILDYLLSGLRGVLRHKMRSLLAVLGIVLAISALLSMLAVGEGARRQILKDMERLGLRNIIINSRRPPPKTAQQQNSSDSYSMAIFGLTGRDAERCKAIVPGLVRIAKVHEIRRSVYLNGRKISARVLGVNADYFRINSLRSDRGRLLCALDETRSARVCVMAAPIPQEVLHGRDPHGMDVSIEGRLFRVVGTAASEAALADARNPRAEEGAKSADHGSNVVTIYIPLTSAFTWFGALSYRQEAYANEYYKIDLDQIILECEDPLAASTATGAILRKGHNEVDYEVMVPVEVLRERQHTQSVFNLVLLLVSGITLLVGGVGIVNIMLVSVTERTKEIGIRRALGARRGDIMAQFLIETLALTMTGGIIGVLTGFGGIYAVAAYTGWPVATTVSTVAGSFMLSVISGVAFGMYPAHKAASVTPMIALRYE